MTIQEFYEATGGSYENAIARLMSDKLIIKFSGKFLADGCFGDLMTALDTADMEGAFRYAHTIKGLALNLEYTKLAHSAGEMTEKLREKDMEGALSLRTRVEEDYRMTCEAIKAFIGEQA